jgi:hypothetical protein
MKKEINFRDLLTVDYTDGSWPEDELGQLAYNFYQKMIDENITKGELNLRLKRVNQEIKKFSDSLQAVKSMSQNDVKVATEKLKSLVQEKSFILKLLHESTKLSEDTNMSMDEALTLTQRMRRRALMRRLKSKIAVGRRRAMRRKATVAVIQRRAYRAARAILAKKLLKKNKADASYGEKVRVEKILKKRKAAIMRLARKLIPVIRKKEKERFSPKQDDTK